MTKNEFVTVGRCMEVQKMNRWLFGIIFTIMGLFVVMAGWSITTSIDSANASTKSMDASEKIGSRMDVHEAREIEIDKNIMLNMTEIKNELIKVNNNVADINKKLWDNRK